MASIDHSGATNEEVPPEAYTMYCLRDNECPA